MIPNPNVPGATLDDDPLVQLVTDLGIEVSYRRSYAPAATPVGNLTLGTTFARPVGTRDSDAFDSTQDAILDSTVDANTGFQGSYASGFTVHAFLAGAGRGTASMSPYGVQLDQPITCYLLSREVVPVRGDLLIHPNGVRYVVGEEQRALGTSDRPAIYAVGVEARDPTDPVYTV